MAPKYAVQSLLPFALEYKQAGAKGCTVLSPGITAPVFWFDAGMPRRLVFRRLDGPWCAATDMEQPYEGLVKMRDRCAEKGEGKYRL